MSSSSSCGRTTSKASSRSAWSIPTARASGGSKSRTRTTHSKRGEETYLTGRGRGNEGQSEREAASAISVGLLRAAVRSPIPLTAPHDQRSSNKRRQGRGHDHHRIQDRHYRTSARNVTLPVSDINASLTIAQLAGDRPRTDRQQPGGHDKVSV
jgi:hypothetical protein